MVNQVVVVENKNDWSPDFPDSDVVLAKDYLTNTTAFRKKDLRVINLCRSYRYLSVGYYCSLLGEARKHKVLPSVRTLTDLSRKAIYGLNVEALDDQINKVLRKQHTENWDSLNIDIFFGNTKGIDLADIARNIFDIFPCPLLNVEFRHRDKWEITSIKPVYINQLKDERINFFVDSYSQYQGKRWRGARSPRVARYDLAMLYNPNEHLPPSNLSALKKFTSVGKKMGINVELIQRKDYNRLAEYDALFIRETTAINHHTYRFAKKAETEGMVVIDDPDSIVKCTNKVYLFELLTVNRIPVPQTQILTSDDYKQKKNSLTYPVVLKIPDGSFSRGIYKADDEKEAREISKTLLSDSEIILAQEFMYTDYDWRIGILNNQVIFACQYFMSKSHWQIVKHESSGRAAEGGYKSWPVEDVPTEVIRHAEDAAKLIGSGLYGVDIKQTPQGVFVIEVNDNPNIETGVEDGCLGDKLYEMILQEFVKRMELRRAG
jgi:glutathione synthase/RimK-type ligase-like ATP-grasp enzyme